MADAFVEAMARSTEKFVTVEHFDAAVEKLDTRIGAVRSELLTRIDGLQVRIDAVRTEMQASIARSHLLSVGVMIAANALMIAIISFVLTQRAGI